MGDELIEDYLNKVYLGDIMELLKNLPEKSVDMVFSDADYNVGIKYGIDKKMSCTTSFEGYIGWYIRLARECVRVVKRDGNMFFVNYPRQNSYLRVYLDRVTYEVVDYVWIYNTNVGHSDRKFTNAHRSILHCRMSENNKFYKDNVRVEYKNPDDKRVRGAGRMPYSWLYHDLVKNVSKEKTVHSCMIPQPLSAMLIKSCTMKGDIVLVLFGGSGSELEVCKAMERNFISCEKNFEYWKMINDRLESGIIDGKYRFDGKSACVDKLEIKTKEKSLGEF